MCSEIHDASGIPPAPHRRWHEKRHRAPLVLFLASLVVYNANLRWIGSHDTLPSRYLPFTILTTGTVWLDSLFPEGFDPSSPENLKRYYWVQRSLEGRIVSRYPIVIPILTTPLYVPVVAAAGSRPFEGPAFEALARAMEKLTASLIAALSVVILYQLLCRFTTPQNALLLAIAYGFATETWVIGSQALWPHGMSELLLASLMLLLVQRTPGRILLAGAVSALLVANRAPNLIFAFAATYYVFRYERAHLARFLLFPLLIASALVSYNLSTFGSLMGGYGTFSDRFTFPGRDWLAGLAGLLFSPGRGLLIFSPFLAFLPFAWSVGAPLELRRLLQPFGFAAVMLIGVYAAWPWWHGASSYGPRMMTDLAPVLVLALVPAVERLEQGVAKAAFVGAVGFGVCVQAVGAFVYPLGSSGSPQSVWRLSDAQFVVELRASFHEIRNAPKWARGLIRTFPGSLSAATRNRLPDDAFRLRWGTVSLPAQAVVGQTLRGSVSVTNESRWTWPDGEMSAGPRGSVRLGYRWQKADGTWLNGDGRKFDLEAPLLPGDTADLSVAIPVPEEPDAYTLVLDLLQQGTARFEEKGSQPLRVAVRVREG